MAAGFHYEWYTVDVTETTGLITWEIKAKNRDSAVKQIQRQVKKQNENRLCSNVVEVHWDTLVLDRIGYQRLS